ncbi:MAG: SPFH domain-containing protein, partial [Bacteroidota bacterium]
MSLMRFFIEEFVEVIEWREQDRDTILWKFPDRDANIKYGASLTVRESQYAMLLNEGALADEFDPGMYELLTENMPLLTSLKNW